MSYKYEKVHIMKFITNTITFLFLTMVLIFLIINIGSLISPEEPMGMVIVGISILCSIVTMSAIEIIDTINKKYK